MKIYTRINIEVVPSYEYSFKITEEPELTYTESSGKSVSIFVWNIRRNESSCRSNAENSGVFWK